MAWLSVDMEGNEFVSSIKPEKIMCFVAMDVGKHPFRELINLNKGSIKKLIGRELTFEDSPVELKEESV